MELIRKPLEKEIKLIELLINKSLKKFPTDWKNNIEVRPMDDGGMGGLIIYYKNAPDIHRQFGEQIAEFHFTDKDGVEIIVSLNTDNNGNLFELDVWKTDFSRLIELPDV